MKTRLYFLTILISLALSSGFAAGEINWTPEMPYNIDRRQSASGDDPSPWNDTPARGVEYRLLYLLEADRSAKKLRQESKLSEKDRELLHSTIDNLDEVLETCYAEAIPRLAAQPNPTLLKMLLYHYNTYVQSAMERWPSTIDVLRKLDPAITAEADKLAKSEKWTKIK